MTEVPDHVLAYFRELGLEHVWLLDGSDASEHVYLARPEDCSSLDREKVERELIRRLGIKVYFGPLVEGVKARLVYQRD